MWDRTDCVLRVTNQMFSHTTHNTVKRRKGKTHAPIRNEPSSHEKKKEALRLNVPSGQTPKAGEKSSVHHPLKARKKRFSRISNAQRKHALTHKTRAAAGTFRLYPTGLRAARSPLASVSLYYRFFMMRALVEAAAGGRKLQPALQLYVRTYLVMRCKNGSCRYRCGLRCNTRVLTERAHIHAPSLRKLSIHLYRLSFPAGPWPGQVKQIGGKNQLQA